MAYRASKVILLYVFLFVLSAIFTYGLALGQGHIDPFVPFLGQLGDQPLESTVFTQFFVVVACILALVVQVHYVSVAVFLEKNEASGRSLRANAAGLYAGYVAASGLFVLACFQESHTYYVHHIAETVFLLSCVVYCSLHTFISIKERDPRTRRGIRLFLNLFMALSFAVFLASYVCAMRLCDKPWEERYHWSRHDRGWLAYILSATSQWLCIGLFHIFLFTCYPNMNNTILTKTSIIVVHEND